MRTRARGRGVDANASASVDSVRRPHQVAAVGRSRHPHAGSPAQFVHHLLGAGIRHHGQRADRRQVELGSPGECRRREPPRVGVQHGVQHLVAGQAGLDQDPPAVRSRPEQPGGAGQQCEGLLVGSEARRQQLVVEVEEGHHVGVRHTVQHGLGPDVHVGRRQVAGRVRSRHLHHRSPCRRLELVAQRAHPGPERGQRRRAAALAHHRTLQAAAGAAQPAVPHLGHGGLAPLAALQRPARPAGQASGPAGRVQHAHHQPVRVHQVAQQPAGDQRPPPRLLLRPVHHLQDRPAGPLLVATRHLEGGARAQRGQAGDWRHQQAGRPARRARSSTTSRACHVGDRSSWSASSCSSRTTPRRGVASAPRPRPAPRARHPLPRRPRPNPSAPRPPSIRPAAAWPPASAHRPAPASPPAPARRPPPPARSVPDQPMAAGAGPLPRRGPGAPRRDRPAQAWPPNGPRPAGPAPLAPAMPSPGRDAAARPPSATTPNRPGRSARQPVR